MNFEDLFDFADTGTGDMKENAISSLWHEDRYDYISGRFVEVIDGEIYYVDKNVENLE